MKKLVIILLALALVLPLAACTKTPGPEDPGKDPKDDKYELALVTDIGTIDDKSFNQGAWEGLKKYAEEKKITYKYYQPAEKTDAAYLDSIDLAVKGGAKLIVCPGYLFEPAVFEAQDLYPEVKFIILDGNPNDGDWSAGAPTYKIEDNVYSVIYAEEEAGFLAGYATVKDGYKKLGFMGGMAVPAVIRFGYGYVQGAEYAAKEMGISGIEIMYHYTGSFDATPEAKTMAAGWYEAGTEVIFACGGAVGNSVMAAAEEADKAVIGVDVDQSPESDTVITSSLKMLAISVYDGITAFYAGTFPGGKSVILDATVEGVGLPMATSKFKTFSQADYDAIYKKLVDGEIEILKDTDQTNASDITLSASKVTFVE
ncbi:MAG: BMP family ABC transporter substrate-binding protein [Eubacteriales bacterium]|nr:BMP family ABC transporter substrate-binding protein [Eubacteriales bacterium]MDD4078565.1 BMP family ABC transporter substrate-binding protein [Eubacteriales bacterium]